MKLLRYGPKGRERPALLDAQGKARDLSSVIGEIDAELLETNFACLRQLDIDSLPCIDPTLRIAPPVSYVGKIVCVGLNYADHAREAGKSAPTEPVLFLKATSAICGPYDDIELPPEAAKADWEVELGVVIGIEARRVSREQALQHVAALCVVNDLSERAFQLERGGQWDKGKSCDTFAPIGPYLVSVDDAGDIARLDLWCDVNGERMQRGNTRDMIFDVPYLVHYISHFMSLQPGDIISTGTPAGVGLSRRPPVWLREGDEVSAGISGLGEQRQRVTRAWTDNYA